MFNKSVRWFVVLLLFVANMTSFATRKDEVTMVLVPRDEEPVKLGMDIANRYPTLLVSYQVSANSQVSLNGWTGSQWVNISVQDFQDGNFFRTGPDSALLIEHEGMEMPRSILPPDAWASSVYKITTTKMRPLLHLVGQYYDFEFKDWQWFSNRYDLPLEAINPEGLNVAWYHKPLKEHLKRSVQISGASDLQYWIAVRVPKAAVPSDNEAVTTEAYEEILSAAKKQAEDPAPEEQVEEPEDNPLTNSVPEAVILGPGGAEEEINTSVSTNAPASTNAPVAEAAEAESP